MTKTEMTAAILEAKKSIGTSWRAIAEAAGLSPVFTTSACLGENTLDSDDAEKVCTFLGLPREVMSALTEPPLKGEATQTVPKDPLIYRFQEITYVYGRTLKELIDEEFGPGIMSAIDFTMDLERIPDPHGDRVKITMSGKFLPYKKW